LLNKKGQVKLADFGISAFLDADETRRRTQIGSPFWMSPELILGEGYSYKVSLISASVNCLVDWSSVAHN
jgi:serine/threonine protein kinase